MYAARRGRPESIVITGNHPDPLFATAEPRGGGRRINEIKRNGQIGLRAGGREVAGDDRRIERQAVARPTGGKPGERDHRVRIVTGDKGRGAPAAHHVPQRPGKAAHVRPNRQVQVGRLEQAEGGHAESGVSPG